MEELLLKTKRVYDIQELGGGQYYHFGLLKSVKRQLAKFVDTLSLTSSTCLALQINVDGLPLFKSSSLQLWPILGRLLNVKTSQPFVIGIFSGKKKPSSNVEFLKSFVADLISLESGFMYEGKSLVLQLKSVLCDSPARSFIKNTKLHNAHFGCERCHQYGQYVNHRMTFPLSDCEVYTDKSFFSEQAKDHLGPNWTNPFLGASIGFITSFPLDYMHLVCLGVMRRLLSFWLRGPLKTRMSSNHVEALSKSLIGLRPYTPSEFVRKPRTVQELDRWKATEFRQFLLYTGPLCLTSVLDEAVYHNFLLLFAGISILVCPKLSVTYADYAMALLKEFVAHYGAIYGKDVIVYNVHGLIHLSSDVKVHGPLDNFSCFPFENYLQKLKKFVRKPEYPLAQIIRRLSEQNSHDSSLIPALGLKKEHFHGPVPSEFAGFVIKQFEHMLTDNFIIKLDENDNTFLINNDVCVVLNIIQTEDSVYIVYKKFKQKKDFFEYPFKSSFLGIFAVSSLTERTFFDKAGKVEVKCARYPWKNQFVTFPLRHTEH